MTSDLVSKTVEEGQVPQRMVSSAEITSLLGYADFAADFVTVDLCKKALKGDQEAIVDCGKLLDCMNDGINSWRVDSA